jgi:hypothetical protein
MRAAKTLATDKMRRLVLHTSTTIPTGPIPGSVICIARPGDTPATPWVPALDPCPVLSSACSNPAAHPVPSLLAPSSTPSRPPPFARNLRKPWYYHARGRREPAIDVYAPTSVTTCAAKPLTPSRESHVPASANQVQSRRNSTSPITRFLSPNRDGWASAPPNRIAVHIVWRRPRSMLPT